MTYATAKNAAFGFLLLYALIGMWGHVTRSGVEDLYPFFSWSLFAEVPPRERTDFDAYVIAVDGEALQSPLSARDIPGLVEPSVNYQTYSYVLSEFGRAIQSGDESAVRAAKEVFDGTLTRSAVYEIRAVTFDPIRRFLRGELTSTLPLRTFSSEETP